MWNGIAFWRRHLPLDTKESSPKNAIVCWCSHENLHTIYILRSLSKSCAKIHYAHILSASAICSEIHKLHTVFVKISTSVVESCNVFKFVQCTLSTFQRAVRCYIKYHWFALLRVVQWDLVISNFTMLRRNVEPSIKTCADSSLRLSEHICPIFWEKGHLPLKCSNMNLKANISFKRLLRNSSSKEKTTQRSLIGDNFQDFLS